MIMVMVIVIVILGLASCEDDDSIINYKHIDYRRDPFESHCQQVIVDS